MIFSQGASDFRDSEATLKDMANWNTKLSQKRATYIFLVMYGMLTYIFIYFSVTP